MADLLYVFDVTCAQSVPASAPVEVQTVVPGLYVVSRITFVIPDGHSGLTGIAAAFGHNPVIPANPGAFISGNDEVYHYELGEYPPGVAWSVFLCNNDLQSHVWETRWELNLLNTSRAVRQLATIPASDIYSAINALTPVAPNVSTS